jgi:hypothetical protein
MMKTRSHFWHTSCDVWCMAKKVNTLKLSQASRAQAEIMDRRPSADTAALYLMQIRSPRLKISAPRKRLAVLMDPLALADVPCPVKIRHVD